MTQTRTSGSLLEPVAAQGGSPAPTPRTAKGTAPDGVPDKFRDPKTGEVRLDLLLGSYLELERKLARMVEVPGPDAGPESRRPLLKALGVPDTADAYQVAVDPDGPVSVDPDVNRRLHAAGFTAEQVQLVYDLAGEKMIPAIGELAAAFEAEKQVDALIAHFGSEEKWAEVAKSLAAWGRKTMSPPVFEALSATADGVIAMHKMMASGEPGLLKGGEAGAAATEEDLKKKMADPRYWRDKDPALVREVTEGFKRLYPG